MFLSETVAYQSTRCVQSSIQSINNLVFFNDRCDHVTGTNRSQLQAMSRGQFDKTSNTNNTYDSVPVTYAASIQATLRYQHNPKALQDTVADPFSSNRVGSIKILKSAIFSTMLCDTRAQYNFCKNAVLRIHKLASNIHFKGHE